MNPVRVKDLALVAVAGGLLAFELASISEALPNVKKALAERGWSERVEVASASTAAVPLPTVESPAPIVSPAQTPVPMASSACAKAAKRHASMVAAASSAASKRCSAVARARDARRAHERLRVVRVTADGSCAACVAARTVEKRREIEKAVNLALKQATL